MENNYFTLIGLVLNTFGSILLLWPLLKMKKSIDDDFVFDAVIKVRTYTQKKHLKERLFGIWGLVFLSLGFILQIIPVLIIEEL